MTDVDARLRELFDRKASEVPPHGMVPRSLRTRSRRRIALNGAVALAVVVALGGGAAGVLRAVDRAGRIQPDASDTQPSPHRSTSGPSATLPGCTAGQLRFDAQLEGAMGSRAGQILATNVSSTRCTVRGEPTITLLTDTHAVISNVDIRSVPPAWTANDRPQPAGWPVVTLRPGAVASIRLSWSNWCGGAAPLWEIGIAGGDTAQVYGMDGTDPPPCNGQDLPSTIQLGPFEPPQG